MEVWTYHETSQFGTDLTGTDMTGYEVEALDGSIGKVDEATYEGARATSSWTPARGSSARR